MSSERLYFGVHFDKIHAHFYDNIESFSDLHAGRINKTSFGGDQFRK
jgi:hypothetical protein